MWVGGRLFRIARTGFGLWCCVSMKIAPNLSPFRGRAALAGADDGRLGAETGAVVVHAAAAGVDVAVRHADDDTDDCGCDVADDDGVDCVVAQAAAAAVADGERSTMTTTTTKSTTTTTTMTRIVDCLH